MTATVLLHPAPHRPMRTRTPVGEAWSVWRRCLAGERVPIEAIVPACGLWALRRGGLRRPVRIDLLSPVCPDTGELTGPEDWRATLSGHPVPWGQVWPHCARDPVTPAVFAALSTLADRGSLSIAREVFLP